MQNRQDFSDIGERIQQALQDAAETMDFGKINGVVTETVNTAVEEVRRQVELVRTKTPKGQAFGTERPAAKKKVRINQSDKVKGILYTVFGSIGMGLFGILAIVLFLVGSFLGDGLTAALSPALFCAVLAAAGILMLSRGCSIRARLKRADRYARLGRERMYVELEELAHQTGSSLRKVRADVRSMLRRGIFPEGRLDREEKYLLLSEESWQQYKAAEQSWRAQEEKSPDKSGGGQKNKEGSHEKEPDGRDKDIAAEEREQARQLEAESRAYMDRLRELNIEIPGEVISNKLYELDYLLQRIFGVLQEHPKKAPQMKKFMEYYLPATVKLVESYAEFDRIGVNGENIASAKEEIEKTMDTINHAFEQLINDLFQSDAFEAEADAQVLKTMLAQDGYGKRDFSQK